MAKMHQLPQIVLFSCRKEKRQQENEVCSDPNSFCRTLLVAVHDAILVHLVNTFAALLVILVQPPEENMSTPNLSYYPPVYMTGSITPPLIFAR